MLTVNRIFMLRILLVAAVALSLVGSSSAVMQSKEWGKLTFNDKSFTVMLPEKPTVREYDEKTKGGQLHVINISAYPNMSWAELTVRAITANFDEETETRLDHLCSALIKEFDTKLVSETDISLATFKGREVTAVGGTKGLKARAYVSDRKAFLLFATIPAASTNTDQIDKFLNSFEINEKH
jgi:hypothetical protein